MSSVKVAINGYGRIGRAILRAWIESEAKYNQIDIIAINDLGDLKTLAHLTQYDSTHGTLKGTVSYSEPDRALIVNQHTLKVFSERAPEKCPWSQLGVDIVLECTGFFTQPDKARLHLLAGARKVLISAPSNHTVPTIVYGVNHQSLTDRDIVVSNASCTTNALAPIVKLLQEQWGIEGGLMTTIHAYTNDQVLCDVYHSDLRRARSATQSMIPTKTGAASAIGLVLPELNGKLEGLAVRVPVLNVSLIDLAVNLEQSATLAEIHAHFQKASETTLQDIVAFNTLPLVSVDFNHHSASTIIDSTQTKVLNRFVKILAWYDNEWGFANRMLDTTLAMAAVGYCVQ